MSYSVQSSSDHAQTRLKRLEYFLLLQKKMAFAATTAKILRGKKDKEGKKQSFAGSCQSPEEKVAVSKQKHFHLFLSSLMRQCYLDFITIRHILKDKREWPGSFISLSSVGELSQVSSTKVSTTYIS